MEDRYLFKGKRVDNKKWVEGNILLDIEKNKPSETYRIYPIDHVDICRVVDETTICQCTGLKDKNGKLIWENDICKYYNPEDKDGVGIIKDDYVSWIKGTIATKELMTPLFYLRCGDEWEVIGNIFDNPELLESEG